MADVRAVMAVGEALAATLRGAYDPAALAPDLEFRVVTARDFTANQLGAGVSFLLYRITPNGTHRAPAGRFDATGRRRRSDLPLDLHYLMTVWGGEASLQHLIAGWAMRTLEDATVLPASLLNVVAPGAFRPDEIVELSLAELSNEDLLRLWETMGANTFQLSIPYLARVVRIESLQPAPSRGETPVQERVQDAGALLPADALER